VTRAVRSWILPSLSLVGIALALVAALIVGSRQPPSQPVIRMSPSPPIGTREAVMAAISHYYDVEARARQSGDAGLIDAVTTGPASLASQNFKAFVAEEAAMNRRTVILENRFDKWAVTLSGTTAEANFSFWLVGHDIAADSSRPVEADGPSQKRRYRMSLELSGSSWLVRQRDLLGPDAS
jgi:hypothetical protein